MLLSASSPPSSSRCIVLDQPPFFDELEAILDQVATYQEPIYVVGDFNIRLDRPDSPHADQLRLLAECYGFTLHDTGPTHQLGGTLDAVITRDITGVLQLRKLGSRITFCCTGRSIQLARYLPP